MTNELGRLALALGALTATWAAVTAAAAARTGRADFLSTAWRGIVAATGCAALVAALLVAALVRTDLTVALVADRWSLLVPARFGVAALLGTSAGALPVWAMIAGAAGLGALHLARGPAGARAWATGVVGGAVAVPLAVSALFLTPFAAVSGFPSDGAGLPPDLQRDAAVAHAAALLAASALCIVPFVLTLGALAGRSLDGAWSRAVRPWNAAVFALLVAGLAAGVRWYAGSPLRGDWLSYRGAMAWLVPGAMAAWLVLLDHGRQRADRVVVRTLLSAGTFMAATAALTVMGGVPLRAAADGVALDGGAAFAAVPVGAMLVLVRVLRSGKGALGGPRGVLTPESPPIAGAVAGWLVRAGVILVAGAAAGSYATRAHVVVLGDTEIFRARDPFGHQWSFKSQGLSTLRRENYASLTLTLLPERDDVRRPLVSAELRSYLLADDTDAAPPSATGGIITGPFVETRVAVVDATTNRPTIRVSFVPLGSWLVPGAVLLAFGAVMASVSPHREATA